jgi:type VI protein secretion system component VasK
MDWIFAGFEFGIALIVALLAVLAIVTLRPILLTLLLGSLALLLIVFMGLGFVLAYADPDPWWLLLGAPVYVTLIVCGWIIREYKQGGEEMKATEAAQDRRFEGSL